MVDSYLTCQFVIVAGVFSIGLWMAGNRTRGNIKATMVPLHYVRQLSNSHTPHWECLHHKRITVFADTASFSFTSLRDQLSCLPSFAP